ncbi:MAG: branched-chain amino acid aminotransferase, partial [Pseudomonadota bacterium]
QRDGQIWIDGALVPWREAKIHVLSHGLHYASAVFEGERVYGGTVFALAAHGERLKRSCAIMDMECPFDAPALDRAAIEVVRANDIGDGYLRRVAWRGAEQIGVAAQATKIHVAIAAWPWPRYFSEDSTEQGLRLAMAEWRRPAPDTAPVLAKAACLYGIGTLAKHAAERAGCDDALMLDWRGQVAEATGANIFLIRDGVLHTPVADAFLDGITRQTVIELARARGLRVTERIILPDELPGFDACFVTGTAAEVAAVRQIGEHSYSPHAITRQLADDYAALVRRPAPDYAQTAA